MTGRIVSSISTSASPDGKEFTLVVGLEGGESLALKLTPDTGVQFVSALGEGLNKAENVRRGLNEDYETPTRTERTPEKLVKKIRIGTDAFTGTPLVDLLHIDGTATQYLIGKEYRQAILQELNGTTSSLLKILEKGLYGR